VLTLEGVERALRLPAFDARRAQRLMATRPRTLYRPAARPGRPRHGGALLLLYPHGNQLNLVLTRRTNRVDNHRGQISLPGGGQEPGETLEGTAIREACEELGVCLDSAGVLGTLASLYIAPSDFEIYSFVAHCPSRPEFQPAAAEVAELLEVPLEHLLDPIVHQEGDWVIRGHRVQVPFYRLGEQKVWGATAMVLSEFEQRLRVSAEHSPLGSR